MFGWLGSLGANASSWLGGLMGGAQASAATTPLVAGGMEAAPALAAVTQQAPMAPMGDVNAQIGSGLAQAGLQNGYNPAVQAQGAMGQQAPSLWDRFTTAATNPSFAQGLLGAAGSISRNSQQAPSGPMAPSPSPMSTAPRGGFTPIQMQQSAPIVFRPRTTLSGLLGGDR